MRNGHVDWGGGVRAGEGGSPWRASRGPRAPRPRDHGESGRGGQQSERARLGARCRRRGGRSIPDGGGGRASASVCVSLKSFTAEQPARSPRRWRRRRRRLLRATVPPTPTSSSFLLLDFSSPPPHSSMGSRPSCRHLLSAWPGRHQLPPPRPRAAPVPGAPAPGVAPGSRRPQPRLARRSAHPN